MRERRNNDISIEDQVIGAIERMKIHQGNFRRTDTPEFIKAINNGVASISSELKNVVEEKKSGENDATEYQSEIRRKIDNFPSNLQELLRLLDSFDLERLKKAFDSNLWRNQQIPTNYEYLEELLYIIKIHWSGFFNDMEQFGRTLIDLQIHKESTKALLKRDSQKCAEILSQNPNVNFTEEGRLDLKACFEKVLDTAEIKKLSVGIQRIKLSFLTTNDMVADFYFERDRRTFLEGDDEEVLWWQAAQFQGQLSQTLIQLSHNQKIRIAGVTFSIELAPRALHGLDPESQRILAELMNGAG